MPAHKIPLEKRFWSKVLKTPTCWFWKGAVTTNGYGQLAIRFAGLRKAIGVHRLAYEMLVAPIPEGLQIDHLCRNHACVNPAHLEVVTCKENLLRGKGFNAENAAKIQCLNGHPFDASNTRIYRGRRCCRACHNLYMRNWNKEKKHA